MDTKATLSIFSFLPYFIGCAYGLSISSFGCSNIWNPVMKTSDNFSLKDICPFRLDLSSQRQQDGGHKVTIQVLLNGHSDNLKANAVLEQDYWLLGQKTLSIESNETTSVDVDNFQLQFPNICGQAYMTARLRDDDSSVDRSIPVQITCPETYVDLALGVHMDQQYDMYLHRAVIYPKGTPLTESIPGLKMWVRNAMTDDTFISRTGLSTINAWVYLKEQRWYMYRWPVGNTTEGMVSLVNSGALDYKLGDVMVHRGNRLVFSNSHSSGGASSPLKPGHQMDLDVDQLEIQSNAICGNAALIVQIGVPFPAPDVNLANNFHVVPVFVDCWQSPPPRQPNSFCQVIPNYYDNGKSSWIIYGGSGQVQFYEYKAEDKTVRQLDYIRDEQVLNDVAILERIVDVHSDRLTIIDQCIHTTYDVSSSLMALVDTILTSFKGEWDRIRMKEGWQTNEQRKLGLVLSVTTDLLTLGLNPTNRLHDWLHVPVQVAFAILGNEPYSNIWNDYYSNAISRRKRSADDRKDRPLPKDTGTNVTSELFAEDGNDNSQPRNWHSTAATHLYRLIKEETLPLPGLSKERIRDISQFLKTLLWGRPQDLANYSFIPPTTMKAIKELCEMILTKNGVRIMDDLPQTFVSAYNKWKGRMLSKLPPSPFSASDVRELLDLFRNETFLAPLDIHWPQRVEQMQLLRHALTVLLQNDTPDMLHELYQRWLSSAQLDRAWMIQVSDSVGEPQPQDFCRRYASLKLQQLNPKSNLKEMKENNNRWYDAIYWKSENGVIYRGDRSDITGQVFWTKVAQCYCQDGKPCSTYQLKSDPLVHIIPGTGWDGGSINGHSDIPSGIIDQDFSDSELGPSVYALPNKDQH